MKVHLKKLYYLSFNAQNVNFNTPFLVRYPRNQESQQQNKLKLRENRDKKVVEDDHNLPDLLKCFI